ncbi:Chloroperoxidase [Cyathus striatus]|nr:Chloroperoxidase [Cyathus striatus]
MARLLSLLAFVFAAATLCGAFPTHASFPAHVSLAGLSDEDLEKIIPLLPRGLTESPPGPLTDTSAKLVNDPAHPWLPLTPFDIRGPCPGLNTLASHGYLPRTGIATPGQIVTAAQEGFNMGNDLAVFVTYAAFLVDGNAVTNLLSIGGKTPFTGPDPPQPAIVGGLDTHAVFEGDASMTRGDAFFGDNHSFNETLFDQFADFSNRLGAGNYNFTVAAELRHQRILQSIATNPQFSFVSPRYFTAFAESVFPIAFFVDGRKNDGQLPVDVARGFFQESRMPDGFFRHNGSISTADIGQGIAEVFTPHPIEPGRNVGGVNNFTLDPTSADFSTFCLLYQNFVDQTVKSLYPNPKGILLDALNRNLDFLFSPIKGSGCSQVFPFGQPTQ